MEETLGCILFVVLVALLIGLPFAGIWAINTLFAMNLAYTLTNWFAVVVLGFVINMFSWNNNGGKSK